MKTYLVTGGAGFIGANFIHYLFDSYAEDVTVINLDKLTYAGNLNNLRDVEKRANYHFVRGDIGDRKLVQSLFRKFSIDFVVNFAAESHVDRSIRSAREFVETNIVGTYNLLECARVAWLTDDNNYRPGVKFLQVSTDEVYGSLSLTDPLFTEMTPLRPHSPYSASKASADLLVGAFMDTHQFPANITRCSNNYGPYQFPEKLIPLMFLRGKQKQSLPVYGTGKNIRDWLYVLDHCRAIDLVLRQAKVGEIYNIGGNNEKTNIEIVNLVVNFLQKNWDNTITPDLIQHVTDRKGHDFRYAIDSSKIKRDLGWQPSVTFEEGIVKTLQWYLSHEDWLRALKLPQ